MTASDLVAVSTFRSVAEAQIAKGMLDQAGIESMIRTDDVGGMYPGIGGTQLLVRSDDVDNARDALQADIADGAEMVDGTDAVDVDRDEQG